MKTLKAIGYWLDKISALLIHVLGFALIFLVAAVLLYLTAALLSQLFHLFASDPLGIIWRS